MTYIRHLHCRRPPIALAGLLHHRHHHLARPSRRHLAVPASASLPRHAGLRAAGHHITPLCRGRSLGREGAGEI
uniref:Uncharacterized protein n=1 Tax=Oryza punctata TaxID=4537 RepID=A0A0E0KQU5_ORYPU